MQPTGGFDNRLLGIELRSGRDGQGRRLTLSLDRPCVIGDDASADVDDDDISLLPRHARVAPSPAGVMLEPLAGALTTVHGAPVSRPTELQDGDWLALGSTAFQVRTASPAGKVASSPQAHACSAILEPGSPVATTRSTSASMRPDISPPLRTDSTADSTSLRCMSACSSPLRAADRTRRDRFGWLRIIAD
jgi:predicted component of type VI protein secretion system